MAHDCEDMTRFSINMRRPLHWFKSRSKLKKSIMLLCTFLCTFRIALCKTKQTLSFAKRRASRHRKLRETRLAREVAVRLRHNMRVLLHSPHTLVMDQPVCRTVETLRGIGSLPCTNGARLKGRNEVPQIILLLERP